MTPTLKFTGFIMRKFFLTTTQLAYARTLFFFSVGGALGTLLRAWFRHLLPQSPWPWDTLAVNLLASLLIGLILEAGEELHRHVRAFHAVGFCGGLSTFSAFAVEVVKMLQAGQTEMAAAYVVVSVAGCVVAVYLGFRGPGLWPAGRMEKERTP
jgi:CrcB protein